MNDSTDLLADKRRRTKRWMVGGVVVAALAIASWSALRWRRRRAALAEAGTAYATLMHCLIGGDQVEDAEAEVEARRLGTGPAFEGDWPKRCAPFARTMAEALGRASSHGAGRTGDASHAASTLAVFLEDASPSHEIALRGLTELRQQAAKRGLRGRAPGPVPPPPPHVDLARLPAAPLLGMNASSANGVPVQVVYATGSRGLCRLTDHLSRMHCLAQPPAEGLRRLMLGVDGSALLLDDLADDRWQLRTLGGQALWEGISQPGRPDVLPRGDDFAAITRLDAAQLEVTVRQGGQLAVQRLKLATLSYDLIGDHLFTSEPRKKDGFHLVVRKLDVSGRLGPPVDLGKPKDHFIGSRTECRDGDDALFVIHGAQVVDMVWFIGGEWKLRTMPAPPGHYDLDCPGGVAVLTSIKDGKIHEQRCTPDGCKLDSAPLPPEFKDGAVAAVGGELVLASTDKDSYLWARRAPLAQLAGARPILLARFALVFDILVDGDVAGLIVSGSGVIRMAPGKPPALVEVVP